MLAQTEIDSASGESRTTTHTYNALGLLASVDGPRTDVADLTTYDYDAQGNLITSANALGHETRISAHDTHGRPLALQNPNGLVTQLAYDARGRFKSRTVDGQVTLFSYDATGNLSGILLPNGTSLTYTYDAAHRLTAIQDSAGNTITYTLDPLDNRIKEEVTDPAGVLTRTQARVYTSLNRLLKDIGGEGQERSYAYDANGNRLSAIDGRGYETTFAFDALNRLLASTDPEHGVTEYAYDTLDHLTQVKDPKGLETTYTTNTLGDLLLLDSPDTGTTGYAYDSAGNRVSQLDAKGVEVFYRYDALNRLTSTDYVDDTLDVNFIYDEGTNGIGRLSIMTDGSGVTEYGYDIRGNLTSVQTTRDGITHTTSYAYNGADQLVSVTYPSGRTVDYPRNALGQVSSVTTTFNGETQTLATNISYAPFGPMTGLTFGNGVPMNRHLDLDYRLAANIHQGVLEQSYAFDGADNISAIDDNLEMHRNQSFGYDALDRLTSAQGVYGRHSYGYDAAGNRVSLLTDTQSESYSYAPDNHRVQSITGTTVNSFAYDVNGNTTESEGFTFGYGQNNRLRQVRAGTTPLATYTHNGRGERVKKEAGGEGLYFHYDPNGQLLAETDTQGQTLMEYLYLEGMPLAVVAMQTTKPGVYFLQGQHPRNGQPFRLTLEPQTRTLSLEGLGDIDGTYAPEHWTETAEGLLASHTTPSGARLKVKLVLTANPSPSGTLTLTRPPRQARYTLNETTGSGVYSGLAEKTGNTMSLTIDEDTRTLTLLEHDQPPRTLTVDPEHWHLNQRNGAKHLRFGAEAAGLTLKGALHLGKDGRVGGYLKLREGGRQKSRYALTTRPTPSGPAGLFYIHTDHLGTPQVLSDDNQATVWQADYLPFGEATLTKDNVTFNLRFPGQYFDAETGLHYNYYRDYDPTTGRYVQSDPIGLASGINTYTYAMNDPIRKFDSDGLEVRMICRSLAGLAAYTGKQHCFVQVSCPIEGWSKTFSLFGAEGLWPSESYKAQDDPRDDPNSRDNRFSKPIEPMQCFGDECAYEKAVVKRYESFPSDRVRYDPLRLNSNSFTRGLLTGTPYGGHLPPGAPGPDIAPGIERPHPYFP